MKILVTGATGYWGRHRESAAPPRPSGVRLHAAGSRLWQWRYDIPHFINLGAKKRRCASSWIWRNGSWYVHIDELAELFVLAVERAPKGAVLHGVADELTQRDLAAAISRMIGARDRTESYTFGQMFRSAGSVGISLSLNKRLSNEKTRQITDWSPSRHPLKK